MVKPPPDWSLIEADFRAGLKSLRQIGAEHSLTEGAIRKRAKKHDWTRDLSARIQAKAQMLVRKEAVRGTVRTPERIPESDVIDANANLVYGVQMAHRADTARARALVLGLMDDLETLGGLGGLGGISGMDLAEALQDQSHPANNPSEADKRRAARLRQTLDAVLSVPSRIDSGKKLVETLEKLIRIEREIYDITAASADDKSQPASMTDTARTSRLMSLLALAHQRAQ